MINAETHKQTTEDIQQFFKEIGSKIDIWDISSYGALDLEKQTDSGKSLLQDFEGKTIIVLNHTFNANQQEAVITSYFISKHQLIRAANEFGIDFVFLGTVKFQGVHILDELSLPTETPETISTFSSIKDFQQYLQKRKSEIPTEESGLILSPLGDIAESVDNFSNRAIKIHLQRSYSLSTLRKKANSLAKKLLELFPEEQFFLIFESKTDHNVISIRQGPHKIHGGNLFAIECDEESLKSGDFFQQQKSALYLYIGLNLWGIQQLLQDFLRGERDVLSQTNSWKDLLKACMFHLTLEQMHPKTGSNTSQEQLIDRMIYLKLILHESLRFNQIDSQQSLFYQELLGNLLAMLEARFQVPFLYNPVSHEQKVFKYIKTTLKDWIDQNFDTSSELKQKQTTLWEKNAANKQVFQQAVKNTTKAMTTQIVRKAKKQKISQWETALELYVGIVETTANRPNLVLSKGEYTAIKNRYEKKESYMQTIQLAETEAVDLMEYPLVYSENEKGEYEWKVKLG